MLGVPNYTSEFICLECFIGVYFYLLQISRWLNYEKVIGDYHKRDAVETLHTNPENEVANHYDSMNTTVAGTTSPFTHSQQREAAGKRL